ncbi:MAG TPA: hypothetical protein VFU15_02655 [Bacteroidia bacterium]|nr:hypothetical protein [Bacteroidia bacterium]
MRRTVKKILSLLLVAGSISFLAPSCWVFHGKNHCGTCPDFKHNDKPKKVKKH